MKTPGTEPSNAPVQMKHLERQGVQTVASSRRLPIIRGGICDRCGVQDPQVPSQFQYQLCEHFRGLGEMRCSYCPETVNPTDVILHSIINVAEHPDNPDTIIAWCNSYGCSAKHEARFKVNQ